MEDRVKEMLRDRAEDMRLEPDIPRPVVRRARHRRLMNAAVAGTTALAVVAGAVVAVGVALDARGNNPPAVSPTPSEEPSPAPPIVTREDQVPAVWPETNLEDIQDSQRAADDGAQSWRLDVLETARAFAKQVLRWPDAETYVVAGAPESDQARVEILYAPGEDGARILWDRAATILSMARVAEPAPRGIWSVIEVSNPALSVSAGPVSTGEGDPCPTRPLTRGLEAFVCVTFDDARTRDTVDALVFP
jgi:hypothetical protein